MTDIVLINSTLRPNGAQSTDGTRSDNAPFADGLGAHGVRVTAVGNGQLTGVLNDTTIPNSPFLGNDSGASAGSLMEIISDGLLDNFTRVTLQDNSIQDFHYEGVDVQTAGDAQLLLAVTGNDISNNGAGADNDANNDNVFGDLGALADPNNLLFYDGVNIDAFDQSTVSVRFNGNIFRDNFERGVSLNTFNRATINASVIGNTFFGNDRGEDGDNVTPLVANGDVQIPVGDSGIFDFEAINNEEYYARPYETTVFLNAAGAVSDFAGMALPAGVNGFPFPVFGNPNFNDGTNVFNTPVAIGRADINLAMGSNAFQLGPDFLDLSGVPGEFNLGLDGLTNGFDNIGQFFSVTDVPFLFTESIILGEEGLFTGQGF